MTSFRQKAFNKAYIGLAKQKFEQSLDENTYDCLYRGPNGLKCAIGHIISDEYYNDDMEYLIPFNVPVKEAVEKSLNMENLKESDLDFLCLLQECHDEYDGPVMMQEALELFADDYDLEVPKV